jgi:O-antigen ligase
MAASATVSLIAADLPWNLFARTAPILTQVAGWAVFIFAIATYFLVANWVTDQRWLGILTTLFVVIGGLYMLGRINLGLGSFSSMMNNLGSDGSMFWVWLVALASGQLLFNRNLKPVWRMTLGLVLAVTLGISWFLNRSWTSGYLPEFVAVMTILWLRSWKLGLLVTVAGILVVIIGSPHILDSLNSLKSYSIATRDEAREILLEQVFPLSPILGLGPANYYWYTPLYPILGWYVSFNSHNNYVDILMQTGLLGLACFAWFVFESGWLGWRLRNSFNGDFAQGYVYACLGGLAGTLVSCWLADWLLPFAYNIGLRGFRASVLAWLFLGGLVSLEQIARRSKHVAAN